MKESEVVNAVRSINLDVEDYIVVGSGILGALGIREIEDIDLIVSEQVFSQFEKSRGWSKKEFDDGTYYLQKGIVEIGLDWDSPDTKPNLTQLKTSQQLINGIPFISLERLATWKMKRARQKDLIDLKLIDEYMEGTRL